MKINKQIKIGINLLDKSKFNIKSLNDIVIDVLIAEIFIFIDSKNITINDSIFPKPDIVTETPPNLLIILNPELKTDTIIKLRGEWKIDSINYTILEENRLESILKNLIREEQL